MNRKNNILLIITISFFAILVLSKPIYISGKDYFIDKTVTVKPRLQYSPVTTLSKWETCSSLPDGSPDWNCVITPNTWPSVPLVRCSLISFNNFECEKVVTYDLKILNLFKVLTLFLIVILLFIRYKQKD